MKSYLQEKVLSFQTLCESKQIRMQLLLPDSPVSLWMDKDKTDKIFDNLFSNAVKYTPAGGEITVKVEQNDKKITIAVKDNGIGIPRKAQRYIFSNFYRAENAVNSKETGSGIGLLLTRRLMKLHKGHISFSSNEGEGSTFLLTFRKGNRHLAKYIVPARIDTSIIPPPNRLRKSSNRPTCYPTFLTCPTPTCPTPTQTTPRKRTNPKNG